MTHTFQNCSHRPDFASQAEHDRGCPALEAGAATASLMQLIESYAHSTVQAALGTSVSVRAAERATELHDQIEARLNRAASGLPTVVAVMRALDGERQPLTPAMNGYRPADDDGGAYGESLGGQ